MHNLQYDGMQSDEKEYTRRRNDSSSLLKLYKKHQECNMSSDNECEIREFHKEIDYLAEDVES
jgi:hypothetical protein